MLNCSDVRRCAMKMTLAAQSLLLDLIPTEVGLVGIGVLLLTLAFLLHRRRAMAEARNAITRPVLLMQLDTNLCAVLQRRLTVVKRLGYPVPGRRAATTRRRRRLTDEARTRLRRDRGFFSAPNDRWKGEDV
jgi:hypothetical protein